MPLLREAAGLCPLQAFVRPRNWDNCVQMYRDIFARTGINQHNLGADANGYIPAERQEELMHLANPDPRASLIDAFIQRTQIWAGDPRCRRPTDIFEPVA